MIGFIIFSDLKGYSKLSEPELNTYYTEIYQKVAVELKQEIDRAKVVNTWGDAFLLIFEDSDAALTWVFKYREFFQKLDFRKLGIKPVSPRIAGHIGEFSYFDDPIIGRTNVIGTNINQTARIEPVTKAGEIYVSSKFKEMVEARIVQEHSVIFDNLGVIPLAKNFGEIEVFRLRKVSDKQHLIDRLTKADLKELLPDPPGLTKDEINTINFLKSAPDAQTFKENVAKSDLSSKTGEFQVEAATMLLQNGLFTEALDCINRVENLSVNVNGVSLQPYKFDEEVQKAKANCLSRLGQYESAINIVYGLWKFGFRDSNTLSMLAAQYKRQALIQNQKPVDKDKVNIDLLNRAKDLYLEAFRIDMDDFYPAINVAYLYKIMGGLEAGKGTKFAEFIATNWENSVHKSWWLEATLAEAEILRDDFSDALTILNRAIENHKPTLFERLATADQISLYGHFAGKAEELKEILKILNI